MHKNRILYLPIPYLSKQFRSQKYFWEHSQQFHVFTRPQEEVTAPVPLHQLKICLFFTLLNTSNIIYCSYNKTIFFSLAAQWSSWVRCLDLFSNTFVNATSLYLVIHSKKFRSSCVPQYQFSGQFLRSVLNGTFLKKSNKFNPSKVGKCREIWRSS